MGDPCHPSATYHPFSADQGNEANSSYVKRAKGSVEVFGKTIRINQMIKDIFGDNIRSDGMWVDSVILAQDIMTNDDLKFDNLFKSLVPDNLPNAERDARYGQYANTIEAWIQMRNEIMALSYIQKTHSHNNIVKLINYEVTPETIYVELQSLELDLRQYVQKHGNIRGKEWLKIAGGVASAVSALHNMDVIHRDIQPANIMLTKEGTAVLIDFGMAKLLKGVNKYEQIQCVNGRNRKTAAKFPYWRSRDCAYDNDTFAMCVSLSEIYVAVMYPAFLRVCRDQCRKTTDDCIQLWYEYCKGESEKSPKESQKAFNSVCAYLQDTRVQPFTSLIAGLDDPDWPWITKHSNDDASDTESWGETNSNHSTSSSDSNHSTSSSDSNHSTSSSSTA